MNIVKINSINKKELTISILFSNGEDRIVDLNKILNKEWKSNSEIILLNPSNEDVKLFNCKLFWSNNSIIINELDKTYEFSANTLYELSYV